MSKINVISAGGCVSNVLDEKGKELEYSLVDYALPEYGECPVCHTEILDEEICPKCGYPVWEEDNAEAIKCLKNWRNWK